jgi:hypothetical protein
MPAPGYRPDLEHRSRAPISCPRTTPQRGGGDPLPDSVGVHSRSHPMSGQHTSAPGEAKGRAEPRSLGGARLRRGRRGDRRVPEERKAAEGVGER